MVDKEKLSKAELEKSLIENFVALQKVLTNVTVKFDELSNNINKLLQLFELSAKNFAERGDGDKSVDQDFLKKLDVLLEQNKVISKGIMLMEERIRSRDANPAMNMIRRPLS